MSILVNKDTRVICQGITGQATAALLGWQSAWGVVGLSVPISLAAAVMMGQIYERLRPYYYVIVVSPV